MFSIRSHRLATPSRYGHSFSQWRRAHRVGVAKAVATETQKIFKWKHDGSEFEVPYDVAGKGKEILLLPSINMASSRKEFRGLSGYLNTSFKTVACDWPGFGDATRHKVNYTPSMFMAFVMAFVEQVLQKEQLDVVACGHASGFALKLAKEHPKLWCHMALIAPTYKAPVKAMGMNTFSAAMLRGAFRTPLLGDLMYGRVTQPSFLKQQYERHVFMDKSIITDEFIQGKYDVVNKSGGQFGPSSFFTGVLDVIQTREEFIELVKGATCPLKVVYGDNMPAKSLAEMEALAEIPDLDITHFAGSLGLAEECPKKVSEAIIPFFSKH